MTWLTQSRDFVRSACGRFDCFCNAAGAWTAIDWDHAAQARGLTLDEAKRWCVARIRANDKGAA